MTPKTVPEVQKNIFCKYETQGGGHFFNFFLFLKFDNKILHLIVQTAFKIRVKVSNRKQEAKPFDMFNSSV